jgi:hypothetical protein
MKILILTNGEFGNGGYATIAKKLSVNLDRNNNEITLNSFIFKKNKKQSEYILLKYPEKTNIMISQITDIYKNKHFDKVICMSPHSLNIASYYFDDIIYFKGGGMISNDNIKKLCNSYILDNNVDMFIDDRTYNLEINSLDRKKIKIIPTVDLLYNILLKSTKYEQYKENIIKPFNYLFYNNDELDMKYDKIYDIIFIISNHKRLVKNSEFAFNVFKKLENLNKIVIGKNCDKYNEIKNTTVINDIIDHNDVSTYFSKSKCSLIVSYYDTGPSTLIESLKNNCIPLTYFNCGYCNLVSNDYVFDNFDCDKWCKKIEDIIENKVYNKYNSSEIEKKIDKQIDLFLSTL